MSRFQRDLGGKSGVFAGRRVGIPMVDAGLRLKKDSEYWTRGTSRSNAQWCLSCGLEGLPVRQTSCSCGSKRLIKYREGERVVAAQAMPMWKCESCGWVWRARVAEKCPACGSLRQPVQED